MAEGGGGFAGSVSDLDHTRQLRTNKSWFIVMGNTLVWTGSSVAVRFSSSSISTSVSPTVALDDLASRM
jgi:hypothetical protein